jgi:hypothetical protein
MKKYLLIVLVSLLLQGCSALDFLSAVNPLGSDGTEVNANAQIGAENTQQVVGNQETITAHSVVQQEIQDIPPWVMLLLILGWLLPSPNEIFHGLLYFMDRLLGRKR